MDSSRHSDLTNDFFIKSPVKDYDETLESTPRINFIADSTIMNTDEEFVKSLINDHQYRYLISGKIKRF